MNTNATLRIAALALIGLPIHAQDAPPPQPKPQICEHCHQEIKPPGAQPQPGQPGPQQRPENRFRGRRFQPKEPGQIRTHTQQRWNASAPQQPAPFPPQNQPQHHLQQPPPWQPPQAWQQPPQRTAPAPQWGQHRPHPYPPQPWPPRFQQREFPRQESQAPAPRGHFQQPPRPAFPPRPRHDQPDHPAPADQHGPQPHNGPHQPAPQPSHS